MKKEKAKGRTYGLLLRAYALRRGDVSARAERVLENARQALQAASEFPLLRIIILVALDYDCGETLPTLLAKIKAEEGLIGRVEVLGVRGYHSRHVLNMGVRALARDVSHVLIVSGKAMVYFTPDALLKIDAAFAKGAKVAGLAVAELRDIVLSGRIQNTFAAWEVEALCQVGKWFDSSLDVEEVAPLIRLVRAYGRCIVPIAVGQRPLEVLADERHAVVMANKEKNQRTVCKEFGVGFDYMRRGVMP